MTAEQLVEFLEQHIHELPDLMGAEAWQAFQTALHTSVQQMRYPLRTFLTGQRVFEKYGHEKGAETAPVPQVREGHGSRALVKSSQTTQLKRFFSNTLPKGLDFAVIDRV
jgi:hypothetical protein